MTAFGRAKVDDGRYEVSLEMASVNKRHLEVSIRLPSGFQEVDGPLRREVSSRVSRGQVTVSVMIRPIVSELCVPKINWAWVEGRMVALKAICEEYESPFPRDKACLEVWDHAESYCGEPEVVSPELEELVKKAFYNAYESFDEKRRAEGAFLAADLRARVETLCQTLAMISEASKGQVDLIKVRLQDLVAKHVPSLATDDRVLREVVLYADKADCSEEIARIDHHLNHLKEAFTHEGPQGKLLEFILQELLREFNTLGAKTIVKTVSTATVLAKTELEKMREQVQNVE